MVTLALFSRNESFANLQAHLTNIPPDWSNPETALLRCDRMTAQELRDEMVQWGLPHTSLGKESIKETNLERLKKYLSDNANETFLDLMHKIKTPADLTSEQISRGKLEHLTKAEDSALDALHLWDRARSFKIGAQKRWNTYLSQRHGFYGIEGCAF